MSNRIPYRVGHQVWTVPWAMTHEMFETVAAIVEREGDGPEALAARPGQPLANTRGMQQCDGIAIMEIRGPTIPYASSFTQVSAITSLEERMMDLQTAMDASEIAGVLLKIDSPGGALTGFAEFAGALRASSTRKRVEAYVGGEACSGAYWLASATSRITVDPTARLGSIGVVIGHVDRSGQDEARGVRKREVVSSQGPQKRADPSTDDGRAIVQQLADRIAAKFIETVAGYRGVSVAHVMAEFGQGGVKVGSDAVAARMADEVGSFESTLAAMRGQLRKPVTTPISSHNPSPRTGIMPSRPTTAATDPHELAALEWRSSPKLQAAFPVLGEYLAFRERGGTGPAGKIDRGAWEREQFAAEYAAHPALAKSFPIVGDYVRFRSNGGRAPSV